MNSTGSIHDSTADGPAASPEPESVRPLVVACGDPAGVGPEVTLKAVAAELARGSELRFVLVGDRAQLRELGRALGVESALAAGGRVQWIDPRPEPLPASLVAGGPVAARAGLDYLVRAADGCRSGEFGALITAPVSKEAILRSGIPFVGQTEFLAGRAGEAEVSMMLLGDDAEGRWLRVVLATTHVRLRDVPAALTVAGVERAIGHAADACRRLELAGARVGVCGLNPHAGEGGLMGDEEQTIIGPAVAAARRRGLEVYGPAAADTLFHRAWRGDYDVVVAMYHDQGLAPLKLVAFERGVNWTLGLPYVRTSPDHGTAYDIAGRGLADPSSMEAAIRLAARLTEGAGRGGSERFSGRAT